MDRANKKIRTVMLLFVVASPLASLVRLGIVLHQYFNGNDPEHQLQPINLDLLSKLPGFTPNDIAKAILSHQQQFSFNNNLLGTINDPAVKETVIATDLSNVLPWLMIVFFFVTSLLLIMIVQLQGRMVQMLGLNFSNFSTYPGEVAARESQKKRLLKKTRRLTACLENYKVVRAFGVFIIAFSI